MRYAWIWAVSILLGCSGGSSGNDDDDRSELPRDTKLSEVDGDLSEALCAQVNGMAHGDALYVQRVCTATGALLGQSMQAKCESERDACIKEPPPLCWLRGAGRALATRDAECGNATLGMFMDCVQGTVRSTKELYAGITCATPSAEVSKLAFDAFEMRSGKPPVECEPFKRACPVFFERPDAGAP